jgi:sorting and assembly machinery component 37
MSATHPIPCTLHIWPSRWNLPSIDPACIAAVFYLQLTIPGKFKVVECTDPDVSPNGTLICFVALACISLCCAAGKLPFLVYGHAAVSSLSTIISFASSLAKSTTSGARDLDAFLNAEQRAKRTAWCSHVEANIGDLTVSLHLCAPFNG